MKFKQLVGLAALSLWASVAISAPASNVQGQRFGDWGAQCEETPEKTNVCYLQQVLSEKSKKEPLMVTVVGYGKGKPFPTAIFELPKGIDMKQGVQLKVDKHQAVSFSGMCDQQGCRAGFTLDGKMFQQLTKGQRALIAYRPNGKTEPTIYPVSLKGLGHGLGVVKAAK